jgi:hypothetical protein
MSDKQTRVGEYIPIAFPSTFHNGWGEPEKGMTLRDYFAAEAMKPFLSHLVQQGWYENDLNVIAETSYRMSSAMLKAREA